jgi:hypothetical protein
MQIRSTLRYPISPKFPGVIGTLALDYGETMNGCGGSGLDKPACCVSHNMYRIPWPCHCCGADCFCCPHSPRGSAWDAALAGGFTSLLSEAATITATIRLGASGYIALAELAAMRGRVLQEQWVPRANAFLAQYHLRTDAFAWVEDTHDDKGNKTGEVLRSALQFYSGVAQPGVYYAPPGMGQEYAPQPGAYFGAPQPVTYGAPLGYGATLVTPLPYSPAGASMQQPTPGFYPAPSPAAVGASKVT